MPAGPALTAMALPPALRAWAEGALLIRLPAGPGHSDFPAMPHAMLTLRLRPAQGRLWADEAQLHTLFTQPSRHAHHGPAVAMGLLLRAEAAACLLGHAGLVQVNQVLPWGQVAGPAEGHRLADELDAAGPPSACLGALMRSFARAMDSAARGHGARVQALCAALGRHGAQAGAELGLGPRQVQRQSQAVLGLGPKQFQRLVRFRGALSQALLQPGAAGAGLAVEAGYHDQSHLLRDVRQFTGHSLGKVLERTELDPAFWPLASHRPLRAAA